MSNLENLRKQAKQYLRWHRDCYYPVAAMLREHLPRYRHLSDGEILAAPFKLADAQELIAREKGFDGWQALTATGACTAMSQTDFPSRPVLTSVAAHLYVRDLTAAVDYYIKKLGFTLDFTYGDPPFYGQVSRDEAHLALRWMDEQFFADDVRERNELLAASITLATASEIKELFVTYKDSDVSFQQPLRTEPWGARTFIVKDPDGNLILFAGPAE